MPLRTLTVHTAPTPGKLDEVNMPTCERCYQGTTAFQLVILSTGWRWWQWLVGRGLPRKAYVVLNPCGHILNHPFTVSAAAHFITLTGQNLRVIRRVAKPVRLYLKAEKLLEQKGEEAERV